MLSLILIVGLIGAVLMIVIVLIQNPKGGGLAANFSSSNQIFGVKRTTEGVEKLTWIFAVIILLVSLSSSYYNGASTGKSGDSQDDKLKEMIDAKPKAGANKPK